MIKNNNKFNSENRQKSAELRPSPRADVHHSLLRQRKSSTNQCPTRTISSANFRRNPTVANESKRTSSNT